VIATLAAAAAGLWSAAAALAAHERRVAIDVAEAAPATDGPLVSVIVPARDEERDVGATVRSLLAQTYPHLELVVVDDESGDDTAARAGEAMAGDPRARLIAGRVPPPGWVGKTWACWQGAREARGDWLLFTDADVVHGPETLACCVTLARELGTGGITLVPRIVCVSVAERVVLPAAFALISTLVAPGPLVRSPRSPVAMAAGGFILVERSLYDRAGGHRGIADRMIDDVSLAEAVKRSGGLLMPVDGTRTASIRLYHGVGEMWTGWRKNASFGVAGGPLKAAAGALAVIALALAPPVALALGLRRRRAGLALLGGVGWAMQAALQRMAAGGAPAPALLAPTMPLGLAFMGAAALRSAADRMGGGPVWRGRRYPDAR
jgi:hypothetical protein